MCVLGGFMGILFQTFAINAEMVRSSSIEKGQEWNKTPEGLKSGWPGPFSIGKCQIIKNEVICGNQSILTESQRGTFPASCQPPAPVSFRNRSRMFPHPDTCTHTPRPVSFPALEATRSSRATEILCHRDLSAELRDRFPGLEWHVQVCLVFPIHCTFITSELPALVSGLLDKKGEANPSWKLWQNLEKSSPSLPKHRL